MIMLSLSMVVRSDHCETLVNTELEFLETAVYAELAENHSALGIRITGRRAPASLESLLDLQDKKWLLWNCWLPVPRRRQAEVLLEMRRCSKPSPSSRSAGSDRAERHQTPFPARWLPSCPHPSEGPVVRGLERLL